MMGWTTMNYYAAVTTIIIMAAGATAANAYFLEKKQMGRAGLALLFFLCFGIFGFIGLSSAPTYSYMERDHWENVFKLEAEKEQIEAQLNEKMKTIFSDPSCLLIAQGTDETKHLWFKCQLDISTID